MNILAWKLKEVEAKAADDTSWKVKIVEMRDCDFRHEYLTHAIESYVGDNNLSHVRQIKMESEKGEKWDTALLAKPLRQYTMK